MAVNHMHLARRCLARTRKGTPCQSPCVRNKKRCRMHGARAGAPKGNTNNLKHGHYSAASKVSRKLVGAALRKMRNDALALG